MCLWLTIQVAAIVHAQYHLTYLQGKNSTEIFEIPNSVCIFTLQLQLVCSYDNYNLCYKLQ